MQTTKANNQVILNSHLQILPIELWINIFSFLPLPSICHSLSYTCKYMYNITKKQELWKELCLREFPLLFDSFSKDSNFSWRNEFKLNHGIEFSMWAQDNFSGSSKFFRMMEPNKTFLKHFNKTICVPLAQYRNFSTSKPILCLNRLEYIRFFIKLDSINNGHVGFGITPHQLDFNGSDISMCGWSYFSHGCKYFSSQVYSETYETFTTGDEISVEINLQKRMIVFYKNKKPVGIEFYLNKQISEIYFSVSARFAQITLLRIERKYLSKEIKDRREGTECTQKN